MRHVDDAALADIQARAAKLAKVPVGSGAFACVLDFAELAGMVRDLAAAVRELRAEVRSLREARAADEDDGR